MLDDMVYTADLCDEHKEKFKEALGPFIEIAKIGERPKVIKRATYVTPGGVYLTKDVRAWLQKQGRSVPDKGRLPENLLEEYARAHNLV